jgi:hypothetical protein
MKRWAIGWIAAAVALAAVLIVVVDIIRTQSGKSVDSVESGAQVTRTSEAARSAGASVTPSDPKQAR